MNFEWTYLVLIWMFVGLGLLFPITWALFRPNWMGFSGKTFWDWIVVLAIPSVLGISTVFISAGQARINLERSEEEAVQQYIDRISELAIAGDFADGAIEALAVGRAQTLAVLQIVDGPRAGRILQFLDEIGLVERFVTEIEGLNLASAELKGFSLSGVSMEDVNLAGADLEEADLSSADFEDVDFRNADLKGANLSFASMEEVSLKGAELDHTDFRGVDMSDVAGLDEDELARACLDERTVLPADIAVDAWTGCSGEIIDDD